jgi:hypothetical protein
LLCGTKHSIKIHQYVRRKTDAGNKDEIFVFRIICERNFELRKKTAEKPQYTLTILPGFLFPQSRVQVQLVFNAINDFLTKKLTRQQAALLMNCESRHSFSLYFSLFRNRVRHWLRFIEKRFTLSIEKEPSKEKPEESGLTRLWQRFKNTVNKIKGESRNACFTADDPVKRLEYVHVLLIGCKNGLGP